MPSSAPPKRSFARTYLAPALFVLAIPVVGLAFSSYQLAKWTSEVQSANRERLDKEIAEGRVNLRPDKRAEVEEEIAALDIRSEALQSCGRFGFFSQPKEGDESFCRTVLQFVWVRDLSLALIAAALITAGAVGAGILIALRRTQDQHTGFLVGWTALRAFGAPHIVGQGLILVFLSFWVTALLFHVYLLKLIGIAAILAVGAMAVAIKALFARVEYIPEEHGAILKKEDAPAFFAHIYALAAKVGTAAPANVVVGIDDNFFVTESPLFVFERYPSRDERRYTKERLDGRTLYCSLSLLRVLERDQLSAILAHELGHFAAGDTARNARLGSLRLRFAAYMTRLNQKFTFGVDSCLIAFRALFERVSQGHSRRAEFAADTVAGRVVGGEAAATALLKVAAYSTYRSRTVDRLFGAMTKIDELKIDERVRAGFVHFFDDPEARQGLLEKQVPHPFDSHPPLSERLGNLGIAVPEPDSFSALTRPPEASFRDTILNAGELEERLWSAFEARFEEHHDLALAHRLTPVTDAEVAHVERHFPTLTFSGREGDVVISWRGVTLPNGHALGYGEMTSVGKKDNSLWGKHLFMGRLGGHEAIQLNGFSDGGAALLQAFAERYGRHKNAERYAAETAQAAR